jgi:hypothetical protein
MSYSTRILYGKIHVVFPSLRCAIANFMCNYLQLRFQLVTRQRSSVLTLSSTAILF